MAQIIARREGALLIIEVHGDIVRSEAISTVLEYYTNDTVKDIVWDFRDGSNLKMTDNDFKALALAVKRTVDQGYRKGGRTVFVGNATVEYGLLRMYSVIAETMGINITYNAFKTLDEAKRWLAETSS